MSQIIVPRPIAWVSTISADGISNLAPFSFFQGVTSCPPTLLFIPVNDREGGKKDTIKNIEEVPEFVINIPDPSMITMIEKTATNLPYLVSEFDAFTITSEASSLIRPPRVSDVPVAIECTLDRIITIGDGPFAANVVFGKIHIVHIKNSLMNGCGLFNEINFTPLARLGGHYGLVKRILTDDDTNIFTT